MEFPLPVVVELALGAAPDADPATWSWTDVTADVWVDDSLVPVSVTRGRADETGEAHPQQMTLRLDNPGGKYTPGNPRSPYFPHVRQGVPVRVRLAVPAAAPSPLLLSGVADSRAWTPAAPALDVTGDLDVRLDLAPLSWRPSTTTHLMARWRNRDADARSWRLDLQPGGVLEFGWSLSGASGFTAVSTAPVPEGGRCAVRATLDVDNGASGSTVTFWTAPTSAGPWTQLGAPVVQAGVTGVYAGSAELSIGTFHDGTLTFTPPAGQVFAAQVRAGIGGTVVADVDFTAVPAGHRGTVDAVGRPWLLGLAAATVDPRIRFVGTVAELAVVWPYGDGHGESRVDLTVAGPRRRMGQGGAPLRSAMYRGLLGRNVTTPRAYWPCEDGSGATQFGSALGAAPPMLVTGEVTAADHDEIAASGPIPTYTTGSATGAVPAYPPSPYLRALAMVAIPDTTTGEPILVEVRTSGTAGRWLLRITSTGNLGLRAITDAGVQVLSQSIDFGGVRGTSGMVWLFLTQSGGNVAWQIGYARPELGAPYAFGGTLTGHTVGGALSVTVGGSGGDLGGTAVGHVAVLDTDEFWDIVAFTGAWAGEPAVARIVRLAAEEGIPVRVVDDARDSPPMGPQRIDTLPALLTACADVDGGLLAERADALALEYRPRTTLYNQPHRLVLDAGTWPGDITGLAPVDDDAALRNDITVTRDGGASTRAVDTEHAAAHGTYDESVTVNTATDAQGGDIAGWRLHLGTWPGMRYPTLSPAITSRPALAEPWTAVRLGDRVRVTGLPAEHPTEALDLIVQGYTETLTPQTWEVQANTTPAGPWTVAVVDDTAARLDTAGSVLATPVTSTATTLLVATTTGPRWTTDPAETPIALLVDGEEVTATTIEPAVTDAFARTVSGGWGTADTGHTWTTGGGASADYSVSGGTGRLSLGSVNVTRRGTVDAGWPDVDLTARLAASSTPTGAAHLLGLIARHAGAGDYQAAVLSIGTDNSVTLSLRTRAGGTETTLTSRALSLTASPGAPLALRLAVTGTALAARAWDPATLEPRDWQVTATAPEQPQATEVGVVARLSTGTTNTLPVTVSVDDVTVHHPQRFTVTRSMNAITKPHTAGADIRLARPTFLAW